MTNVAEKAFCIYWSNSVLRRVRTWAVWKTQTARPAPDERGRRADSWEL